MYRSSWEHNISFSLGKIFRSGVVGSYVILMLLFFFFKNFDVFAKHPFTELSYFISLAAWLVGS